MSLIMLHFDGKQPFALKQRSQDTLMSIVLEQDQMMHGGGPAATQGCPGPERSGNRNTGKASLGLPSGAALLIVL